MRCIIIINEVVKLLAEIAKLRHNSIFPGKEKKSTGLLPKNGASILCVNRLRLLEFIELERSIGLADGGGGGAGVIKLEYKLLAPPCSCKLQFNNL